MKYYSHSKGIQEAVYHFNKIVDEMCNDNFVNSFISKYAVFQFIKYGAFNLS